MRQRFAGMTVAVTGAANGIGLATAQRFLAEGAQVLAVDQDAAGLDAAFAGDPRVRALALDVTAADAPARLLASAGSRLDVLVNNAGYIAGGALLEEGLPPLQRAMAVNVEAVVRLSAAAAPLLAATGGNIVNVASILGLIAMIGYGPYTVSKHALIGASKMLALELAPRVRVNAVCPGVIVTKPIEDIFAADPALPAFWRGKSPLQRTGRPADVAAAIAFLASDDARFVVGHALVVDGGALEKL